MKSILRISKILFSYLVFHRFLAWLGLFYASLFIFQAFYPILSLGHLCGKRRENSDRSSGREAA